MSLFKKDLSSQTRVILNVLSYYGDSICFGRLFFINYFLFWIFFHHLNVFDTTLCNKGCQCLWFSPGTPVSSTNKTDRHDIREILVKLALNTINQTIKCLIVLSLFKRCVFLSIIFFVYASSSCIVTMNWEIYDIDISMLFLINQFGAVYPQLSLEE